MALDSVAFLVRFPEFTPAGTALIDAKIAEALLLADEDILGEKFDLWVGYKTASLLSMSPQGEAMRLSSNDAESIYDKELERISSTLPARGLLL